MRSLLLLLAVALLAPTIDAHVPPGPKRWCESPSDWATHDYQMGESAKASDDDPYLEGSFERHAPIPAPIDGGVVESALSAHGCGLTGPGDSDGHKEFTVGGAYLAASDGGVYPDGPWAGAAWGSVACLGERADHQPQPLIVIMDDVLGGNVGMEITADYARESDAGNTDAQSGARTVCGDHVLEPCDATDPAAWAQVTCNQRDQVLTVLPDPTLGVASNAAVPPFDPGQDGAYIVFVFAHATAGHPGGPSAGHILG